MAVNVKVFGMVSALLGGCIGLPWYLVQKSRNAEVMTPQISLQTAPTIAGVESQVVKPAEKASCSISDSSQASQWKSVLKGQDELYSLVSCQNTSVKGGYAELFGSNWMAWFPKDVLNVTLSLKTGEKFEINVEAEQEDRATESKIVVVFKNLEAESSVRGTVSDFSDIDSSKKSVVISIEGSRQPLREIYLIIDSRSHET